MGFRPTCLTAYPISGLIVLALTILPATGCSDGQSGKNPSGSAGSGPSVQAAGPNGEPPVRREVILSIPGMNCPMCPITVRKALEKLTGVGLVEADLKTKEAMVSFDPRLVSIEQLIAATSAAGFPSRVKQ